MCFDVVGVATFSAHYVPLCVRPRLGTNRTGRDTVRPSAWSKNCRADMRKQPYEPQAEHCSSPVRFAREVLGVDLWSKQEEVLDALHQHRRVAVKSGNGLGRGFSAAAAILWFLSCHDPAVVLSTARPSGRCATCCGGR